MTLPRLDEVINLPDRRRLVYAEYGGADGKAIFLFSHAAGLGRRRRATGRCFGSGRLCYCGRIWRWSAALAANYGRSWGFPLQQIKTKVLFWICELNRSVPPAMGS